MRYKLEIKKTKLVQLNISDVCRDVLTSSSVGEAIVGVYKKAYGEEIWDRILAVENYPRCTESDWKRICQAFIDLGVKLNSTSMRGGAWLNSGFSGTLCGKNGYVSIDLTGNRMKDPDLLTALEIEALSAVEKRLVRIVEEIDSEVEPSDGFPPIGCNENRFSPEAVMGHYMYALRHQYVESTGPGVDVFKVFIQRLDRIVPSRTLVKKFPVFTDTFLLRRNFDLNVKYYMAQARAGDMNPSPLPLFPRFSKSKN